MKLLVADDDVMFRHLVLQTLSHTSLEISSVTNGVEAWDRLCAADPPRLLVLDWMMPDLDGLEVCRKVRELKSQDYTYIILATGRTNKADMLIALEAGVDDYVTKPINRDELLARVQIGRRFLEKEARLTNIIKGWRTMLDNLPFGVAGLGRQGEVLRANSIFVRQTGQDMIDVLGRNLMPMIVRRTCDIARVRESLKSASAFEHVDMELYRRGAHPLPVRVWGTPIANQGDLVFQIITEEK